MALYRKWRPRTFREVAGQEHITRTLLNALKNSRVAHAYLLCGPRGTGKTTTAKVLARALNCLAPDGVEPCGKCSNCLEILGGTSMDVIEIDAASNRGIDEVRELRENIRFSPTSGTKRVYIIDEVHMLTDPAFNALLKTLEEPPGHAVFVLATTEPHKVPMTILSRCQRFDFHRISREVMTARLREVAAGSGIQVAEGALDLIVKAAEGGLRDALSMLDQASSFGDGQVVAEDVQRMLGTVREDVLNNFQQLITGGSAGECVALLGEMFEKGTDLRLLAREITARLRCVLLEALAERGAQARQSGNLPVDKSLEVIRILSAVDQEMRWSTQPRVLLEVALVRCARICSGSGVQGGINGLGELAARVSELEERVEFLAGGAAMPGGQAGIAGGGNGPDVKAGAKKEKKSAAAAGPDSMREIAAKDYVPRKSAAGLAPPVQEEGGRVPAAVPAGGGPVIPVSGLGGDNAPEGRESGGKDGEGALLQKVADRWEDIIQTIYRSKNNKDIYSYLTGGAGAWPSSLTGSMLTVSFWEKDNDAFTFKLMDSDNKKDVIKKIIKSVLKEDLEIRFAISKHKPSGAGKKEEAPLTHDEANGLFDAEEQEDPDGIFDV
jgi:DNA polymerase-3 subunit gamma/tau